MQHIFFYSWTGCPRTGEALGLAYFKTKKADIDARRASLEQARHQASRSLRECFLGKFGPSACWRAEGPNLAYIW